MRCQSAERPLFLGNSFVAIFSERVALLGQSVVAEETPTTGDGHRPYYAIAALQPLSGHIEQFAVEFLDDADRFVSENAGRGAGSSTGKSVEIASTNGAKRNADESLTGGQLRSGKALESKWLTRPIEYRCADHSVYFFPNSMALTRFRSRLPMALDLSGFAATVTAT